MTPRLGALAALAALLAGPSGHSARTDLSGLEWPDWGEHLELSDLRHALDLHPPAEVESWLYNPRERTALGLRRLEDGGPDEALTAFETAGRITPDNREVLFNLGTARLLADHGDAVGALERAVAEGDGSAPGAPGDAAPRGPSLDPRTLQRAYYNLGDARLGAGDAAGAVRAFEEALRRDPSDADAKFNLELALRRLEEERLRLRPPRETPGGERPGEEERSETTGGTGLEKEPGAADQGGRDAGGEGAEAETRPGDGAAGLRPLAGFEEQRDLSAAEAAALLEAVENLERQQRRLEAARTARTAAAGEEDW